MAPTLFSDRIRNEAKIANFVIGNIFEADLCAIARPHLADPFWSRHAAMQQGFTEIDWPK